MKFLADAKNAKFATDLLSAAGFNLDDLRKAGDATALKTALDARSKPVEGPTAEELDQAVKENERLETEATNLKASAKLHSQVCDALAANGIKVSDALDANGFSTEKFEQAFNLSVAKASRVALSRAGHTAIEEQVTTTPTKKSERAPEGLTGKDRVRWAFNQQAARGIN